METKFRSVPITILDFLGILIPGLLWLVLLIESYQVFTDSGARASGIARTFEQLSKFASAGGTWFGPLSIIFAAIVTGYSIKPLALRVAGLFTKPLFSLLSESRGVPWRSMHFPYHAYFANTSYYKKACQVLERVMGLDPEGLPRVGPFAGAKRYLHAAAPALWEESERMEAEVRLLGALFLAAVYSAVLHFGLALAGFTNAIAWAVISLILTLVLAVGFNIVRFREVAYTYVNVVIAGGLGAFGNQGDKVPTPGAPDEDDDG